MSATALNSFQGNKKNQDTPFYVISDSYSDVIFQLIDSKLSFAGEKKNVQCYKIVKLKINYFCSLIHNIF